MSLSRRTFATSSTTEDLPTPVSPTSRIVQGAFVLFFDVSMIFFLRDSTSLENTVRPRCIKDVVVTYLVVEVLSVSCAPTELLGGTSSLEGPLESVDIHGS